MEKTEKQRKKKLLPAIEVSLFCQQAAMILKSGIPMYEGMEILYQNYQHTAYGDAFRIIYQEIRQGGSLYEGMKAADFFPDYMIQMIQVGENAGKLDDVLESLAEYYEKEDRINASVKSALVYPLVLISMMAVVISILVIKVLPVFTEVFRSLGTELSGTAGAILSGGVLIGRVVLVLVALFLVLSLILYIAWHLEGKERILEWACALFLPVRKLLGKQTAQRFASVVSMAMASGYSLENALELIPGLMPDRKSVQKVLQCKADVEANGDFSSAVEKAALFDPLYQKMIRVGVEAGQTDQVMNRIARIYETELEDNIQDLVAWIEPVLVGILTVIIGGILLSVMLPLTSIMTSIS